jgi:hypothetical protein
VKFVATGAGIKTPVEEDLGLTRDNLLSASPTSPVRLGVKFSASTGFVDGTFVPAGSASAASYTGVVLQKAGYAGGFFMNNRLSGLVDIRAVAP